MSANRKLQTEIAQVLKKVEEGVALFDDIWEKVYSAGQQSLKEKYEGDLKKEIKKLQRLRDQIKTWLGGNEIKDKGPLTEARKVIETKMEQFKVCEKDTKTKAYSKEGLARDAKMDPKEAAKEEKRDWLNDCLDRLADLIDSIEADIEKIPNKKKSKDQVDKFENRIKKNRWHIARLEQVLKLMENDDLEPSAIDRIKDDVEYYIESAADDDGSTGVDDEFDIYEELALDSFAPSIDRSIEDISAVAAAAATALATDASNGGDLSAADSAKTSEVSDEKSSTTKKTQVASIIGIGAIGKPQPALAKASPAATTVSKVATAKAVPTVTTPAAAAPKTPGVAAGPPSSVARASTVTPALTAAAIVAGTSASAAAAVSTPSKADKKISKSNADEDGGEEDSTMTTSWATAAAGGASSKNNASSSSSSAANKVNAATSSSQDQGPVVASALLSSVTSSTPSSSSSSSFSNNQGVSPLGIAPILPFTRPAVPLSQEALVAAHMLKMSFVNSPETAELERTHGYVARNPYAHAHPSFPTKPLSPQVIFDLIEKVPTDTCFFAFYFLQGTYSQFLAARQLKRLSWRFHKKYMTWFQRHEEPKIATDEFEEGTYVYFDYEAGWCQLIKQEFKFEFNFLEDELSL